MDYDHIWTNSTGNVTPMHLNNCPYTISAYPEPLYNVRSGPSSLVNLPCRNSPSCPGFTNFFPNPCVPNVINENVRHQPYRHPFNLEEADFRPHKNIPSYSTNEPYKSQNAETFFPLQGIWPENVNMYPNMYEERSYKKTDNAKSNARGRQKNSNTKKVIPSFSVQSNYNHHQVNNRNVAYNCIPKKEYVVKNSKENRWGKVPMPNEQGFGFVETSLQTEDNNISFKNINTNMPMNNNVSEKNNVLGYAVKDTIFSSEGNPLLNTFSNVNVTEGTNILSSVANNTDFNPEHKNNDHLNALNKEHNTVNTNLISGDELTNKVMKNYRLSISDQSACQSNYTPMSGNSTFNVQDIQEIRNGKAEIECFSFEPIYEGKDENGEDIVILLANTNAQQLINYENKTDTLVPNQYIEMQNNQPILNNLTENTTRNNESFLEPQVQEAVSEQYGNVIFSHIDDYGSEEIVTTTKRTCTKTKNLNRKVTKSTDENLVVSVNQRTTENYTMGDFSNLPSTSTERQNYETQSINQPHRIYKPKWKRRLMWRSNEPLMNLQRKYFKMFMEKVKLENEHLIITENFWNMYRTIVTQIGGNVLQTMYNILPALVRNSQASVRRSDVPANLSRNRLQVKFPAKMKYKNNPTNY